MSAISGTAARREHKKDGALRAPSPAHLRRSCQRLRS
jgi:hypothetical protein